MNSIEQDIKNSEDLAEAGLQGGKALGNHLALFSFVIGIPLLLLGVYSMVNIAFGWGFPSNTAILILVFVFTSIGVLMTIGGYFLLKK